MSGLLPDEENQQKADEPLNSVEPAETSKTYTTLQIFLAELIGTSLFLYIAIGSGIFIQGSAAYLAASIAGGLALGICVYVFGRISGCHLNPAVSTAMLILKKINIIEFALYVTAQILGGFLACLFIGISNNCIFTVFGGNQLANIDHYGAKGYISGLFSEIILTSVLILVIYSSGVKSNNFGNLTGLIVGITLTVLLIAGSALSGPSLNPARSIGSAILDAIFADYEGHMNPLKQLWVYVVGPILGGIIGGLLGKFLGE